MFHCSRKSAIFVNRLAAKNLNYNRSDGKKLVECSITAAAKKMHTTTVLPAYAATYPLPIPHNIDAAETTHRFSPHRARDISATVILSQCSQGGGAIDITADNSASQGQDLHLQSYDCCGAVSLNSAMQSNVPSPFGGMNSFSHLNMPGGQWSQDCKFMSQNLHSSHYTELRDNARSGWVADYDPNATVAANSKGGRPLMLLLHSSIAKRSYCTKVDATAAKLPPAKDAQKTEDPVKDPPSKKEQLKKAFKDYGATVVIFHVSISLASLGGCYALVSGGIDLMPVLDYLGLASSALSTKIASGASTFVVAYAIHKVFAPVRISITLGATPFIVRYLRSKGFLKPKIVIKQK